jgi:hypothetical protein
MVHTVKLEKKCTNLSGNLRDLFRDQQVFRLTGADEIKSNFQNGGVFVLKFKDRGFIHGRFIQITDTEINLEWNVEGFGRPAEILTMVSLQYVEGAGGNQLVLKHSNIKNEGSATAKRRSWTEILDKLCGMSETSEAKKI